MTLELRDTADRIEAHIARLTGMAIDRAPVADHFTARALIGQGEGR